MSTNHRILELYSGIGGMHLAWNESKLSGTIAAAIEINTVANSVYSFNFPDTLLMNRNIQSITADDINKLNANVILMSPPCQPFTRNGLQKDADDERSSSLSHILDILGDVECVRYVLLENVKGFESSRSRDRLIETLLKCGFNYREFLISPHQIGLPNSRLRYYCLARKLSEFDNLASGEIITDLPHVKNSQETIISEILEDGIMDQYRIPDKFYKRAQVFDVCSPDSNRSCCFTKAYTHYIEGTGSVFTNTDQDKIKSVSADASKYSADSTEYMSVIKQLEIRFFSPREVARLMAFPDSFNFPDCTTLKQRYRLLGNSINVKAVGELIKILIDDSIR